MPRYVVLKTARGPLQRLGTVEHGLKTSCGRLLEASQVLIEPFRSADVTWPDIPARDAPRATSPRGQVDITLHTGQ
jgi:hypothetical protein